MLYVAACTCRLATRQASKVLLGIACCKSKLQDMKSDDDNKNILCILRDSSAGLDCCKIAWPAYIICSRVGHPTLVLVAVQDAS